jgi:hypothetical protein
VASLTSRSSDQAVVIHYAAATPSTATGQGRPFVHPASILHTGALRHATDIPGKSSRMGNVIKPPFDASHRSAPPGFSCVFRRTIFVPRTQMFCENRSRLNDGRQIGWKASASKGPILTQSSGGHFFLNARAILGCTSTPARPPSLTSKSLHISQPIPVRGPGLRPRQVRRSSIQSLPAR